MSAPTLRACPLCKGPGALLGDRWAHCADATCGLWEPSLSPGEWAALSAPAATHADRVEALEAEVEQERAMRDDTEKRSLAYRDELATRPPPPAEASEALERLAMEADRIVQEDPEYAHLRGVERWAADLRAALATRAAAPALTEALATRMEAHSKAIGDRADGLDFLEFAAEVRALGQANE